MEIRIYQTLEHFSAAKPRYVAKVECPDAFSFKDAISVFRSIYGPQVIIIFLCA